jgi:transaldolase
VKFFADTAEIADIKELAATGLLDGVTTNPSLIMKSDAISWRLRARSAGWSTDRSAPKLSRSTMPG